MILISSKDCPNADLPVGLAGPLVATAFANKTFQSTAARLNQFVEGLNITALDCIGLLSGCAYEVSLLPFLFTISKIY